MNKPRIFILLLILLGFNSCVEKIEFELERLDRERLIVSGTLTDLGDTQVVFLSQTTSNARQPLQSEDNETIYISNDLPRPVEGANVVLVAKETGVFWPYQEQSAGRYELIGFSPPQSGLEYYLQIQVGDQVYQSEPQKMPEIIGDDELSFSFERTRLKDNPDAAQVVIKTEVTLPDQVGGYYLRWAVEEAYFWELTFFPNPFNTPPPNCIVFGYPDPERITLVNGDLLNNPGGKSSQIVAQRLVDQSFLSRHYFNVQQLSVSKETYDYWKKVRELVNNTGSVFDAPPAPIQGNIRNVNDPEEVVLGYFEVAKAKVSRIYTSQADVPYFLEKICEYEPGKRRDQYDPTCLSCSAFPNSVTQYPDWWFDQ